MSNDPPIAADEVVLIDWLKDRDSACPLCGYNLRGLVSPRCPECGQALKLSVSLAEPYLKAWIALIAGLLPPAGIGFIIICVFLYAFSSQGGRMFSGARLTDIPMAPAYILLHLVSSVPLSVLAIVCRQRFLRWRRRIQVSCAVLAWSEILLSLLLVLSGALK